MIIRDKHVMPPHLKCLNKAIVMRGHNRFLQFLQNYFYCYQILPLILCLNFLYFSPHLFIPFTLNYSKSVAYKK